ncbi:ExbD/TolR family protein [Pedosphaera parvula]|uniref:Biopolymer transport protein ExbD/TolR n=1 Tax=Pedosphaera parvula (strain Ellin514) TaxID=320771 RepID=B9XPS6_PEDPL|nr:biopolymer transporter ExbD [Pedosphaera parvula]EEF58199.1 Biopolymer transport protein ExbD/TolR [Pedosphaera parvula Ellin514]
MKFPRNAKIMRGHLDVAPFAGVFFLLVIFLLLTSLVYTPGVRVDLPTSSAEMAGVAGPTVSVGVDKNGIFYFENQIIDKRELKQRLAAAVAKSAPEALTLVVQADNAVDTETWVGLMELAKEAGIKQALQEVLPRIFDKPMKPKTP